MPDADDIESRQLGYSVPVLVLDDGVKIGVLSGAVEEDSDAGTDHP